MSGIYLGRCEHFNTELCSTNSGMVCSEHSSALGQPNYGMYNTCLS